MNIVDKIAHAYGWAAVESMYLEEALPLMSTLQLRYIDEQRVKVMIQHANKPNEVMATLNSMAGKIEKREPDKLDPVAFDNFANMLAQKGVVQVK